MDTPRLHFQCLKQIYVIAECEAQQTPHSHVYILQQLAISSFLCPGVYSRSILTLQTQASPALNPYSLQHLPPIQAQQCDLSPLCVAPTQVGLPTSCCVLLAHREWEKRGAWRVGKSPTAAM